MNNDKEFDEFAEKVGTQVKPRIVPLVRVFTPRKSVKRIMDWQPIEVHVITEKKR